MSAITSAVAPTTTIPPHVPANMIGHFPLVLGAETYENPFDRIIPEINKGPEVFYDPKGYLGIQGAWIFRRTQDLQSIYLDTEHFSNKDFAPFAKLVGESWSTLPAEIDPPMHGLYRALLNPLFTPRRLQALEDNVRSYARLYIDKFKDRGHAELMNEFCFRFPINVVLNLIGLPMDKVETFLEWEHGLLHEPDMAKIADAVRNVKKYMLGVLEERRQEPKDDLVTFALNAEVAGRKLTDDELWGFMFNLFIGGMDTVSTNTSLQLRYLAEHPEQQSYLRAHPDKIPLAVEEMLRALAAVTTFRTCVKPVRVHGVQIMPGDKVAISTALANRDDDEFENPNEVRFDRNPRHLSFGSGIHRCLGAPLARRELIIALEEFLKAIPEFRIAPSAKILTYLGGTIQPATLPIVWGKA
jgi:cytochrome P450